MIYGVFSHYFLKIRVIKQMKIILNINQFKKNLSIEISLDFNRNQT